MLVLTFYNKQFNLKISLLLILDTLRKEINISESLTKCVLFIGFKNIWFTATLTISKRTVF